MIFEFATANRIVFGRGTIDVAAKAAASFGNRVFIITGKTNNRARPILDRLGGRKIAMFNMSGEPTVKSVLDAVSAARCFKADAVVGIGGGSALDAGKVVAALMTNDGDLLDYLEVIGNARPLERLPVPYIAIPTTSGTGAEVTRNAVIDSPEHQVKVSMRDALMLPRLAVVDPNLTRNLPPEATAATGMDALTQLLEAFVSKYANPLTDGLCREGLQRAGKWLKIACEAGHDMTARENMALASLFSGLALANAKLGAVHGFAAPMGAALSIPHSVVCALLLAPVTDANIRALQNQDPNGPGLARYKEAARILTGNPGAGPEDVSAWLHSLCEALPLPHPASLGLTKAHVPDIVAKAARSSSMKGNPIELTQAELAGVLGPMAEFNIKNIVMEHVALSEKRLTQPELTRVLSCRLGVDARQIRQAVNNLVLENRLAYVWEMGSSFLTPSLARPTQIGSGITLAPPGVSCQPATGDALIRIAPGAAFGMGDHPTTRLALKLLAWTVKQAALISNPGEARALDIGTGSGVLALAAAKLGIGQVIGVDTDPCARFEAAENIRINRLADQVAIDHRDVEELDGLFDLILANLRSPSLARLSKQIKAFSSPSAVLIFSGLREDEALDIAETYRVLGFDSLLLMSEKGWAGLALGLSKR